MSETNETNYADPHHLQNVTKQRDEAQAALERQAQYTRQWKNAWDAQRTWTPERQAKAIRQTKELDAPYYRLQAHADKLAEALRGLYEHCAMVHKHWGEGCNVEEADFAVAEGKQALAAYEEGK